MAFSGYYVPNLATGANDGSSLADAWQTEADAEAATSPGNEIWIPEGTYSRHIFNPGKESIAWNACTADGLRELTPSEILIDGRYVLFDADSVNDHSVQSVASINNTKFRGIVAANTTDTGWELNSFSSVGIILEMCGAINTGWTGVFGKNTIRAATFKQCFFINCYRGIHAERSLLIILCSFRNIANFALSAVTTTIKENIFADCFAAADFNGGSYSSAVKNVFYNCDTAIHLRDDSQVDGNNFENCGVAIDIDTDDCSIDNNSYYNNTANYSSGGGNSFGSGEKILTKSKLIDPASGNYMSDPANDEFRNIEYPIDSTNSAFITTGIQPEEASGGPKITSADFGKTAGETINITIENQTSASDSLSLTNVDTSADYSMTIDSRNGDVVTSTIPLGIAIGNYELIYTDSDSNTAEYGYVIEGTMPSPDDVRSGIDVNDTVGNLTIPSIDNVENGIGFGTSGTEFTGTLEARDPITIDSYSTTSGYISGSDEIVLSGTFGSEGDVYFGCNLWENQYWSSTVISGTTPSVDEAQTVKVFVINGDNVAVNFDFTYNENPTVDTYTSYSSLPDSDYFKKCTTIYNSERQLYDLLVTEAYNKTGTCMTYYVTDYDTSKDKLFGEDTDRTVLRSFDIMAHGELPREEQLWSKFGIEGLDNFQIFVAKRHFTAASSQDSYDATVPRIGDMIYMNHNNRTYDVIDVGQEEEMFLQGKHTWIITLSPHQDTHIALSADTSATMGDISATTDQTTDEYDISSYIENEVSAVEFDTSGDSGDAPSTVWGDW